MSICLNSLIVDELHDYGEDICLQTLFLLFKCANRRNKRPFVSTANEALVGTLITIGDVNDILATKHRGHCLISSRGGQATSLQIMGFATIDPHIQKVHNKLYKIPKFGVNRPNIRRDTAIQNNQNLQRNV